MTHKTNAIVNTSRLINLGDAIRAKTGGTSDMTIDEMATAISGISGGSMELYASVANIEMSLSDTGFADWTPSTSSYGTIISGGSQNNYELLDLNQYDYYVLTRLLVNIAYDDAQRSANDLGYSFNYSGTYIGMGYAGYQNLTGDYKGITSDNKYIDYNYHQYYATSGASFPNGKSIGNYNGFNLSTTSIVGQASGSASYYNVRVTQPGVRVRCASSGGPFSISCAESLNQSNSVMIYLLDIYRAKAGSIGPTFNFCNNELYQMFQRAI